MLAFLLSNRILHSKKEPNDRLMHINVVLGFDQLLWGSQAGAQQRSKISIINKFSFSVGLSI